MIDYILFAINKNIAMSLMIIIVIIINRFAKRASYQTKYLNYLIVMIGLLIPIQFLWKTNSVTTNASVNIIQSVGNVVNENSALIVENLQKALVIIPSFHLNLAMILVMIYIFGILIITISIVYKHFILIRYIKRWQDDNQKLQDIEK